MMNLNKQTAYKDNIKSGVRIDTTVDEDQFASELTRWSLWVVRGV